MTQSKRHRGCRMQDPGTRGYRGWKAAAFSHSAGTARGAPPEIRLRRERLTWGPVRHWHMPVPWPHHRAGGGLGGDQGWGWGG